MKLEIQREQLVVLLLLCGDLKVTTFFSSVKYGKKGRRKNGKWEERKKKEWRMMMEEGV